MSSDWQNKIPCVTKRAQYSYENELFTDCQFIVCEKLEIKCHKLLLAFGSPVFQAMFFGSHPESSGPIEIPDIKPSVFQQIIEYIYGKELTINSYMNAFDLFYGAKKYLLYFLERDCVEYLKNNLTPENSLALYEFAKFHDEQELEKQCIMEIQINTGKILGSDNVCTISSDTLMSILDFNLMNISSELVLFKAVENWASNNEEGGKELDQDVSHSLMKHLRFLTLTIQEFAEGPSDSKLLSDSEKLSILLRISKAVKTPLENGLCELTSKRKPTNFKCMSILEITEIRDARCDGSEWLTSVFKTNLSIDLLGVEIRLQVNDESCEYLENLMVKASHAHSDEHFSEAVLSGTVRYNSKAQVLFTNVTTLEPEKEYAIHIFLCRPGMYPIGRHSNLTCKNESVTIEFVSHYSWELTHPYNTTVMSSIIYSDMTEESRVN